MPKLLATFFRVHRRAISMAAAVTVGGAVAFSGLGAAPDTETAALAVIPGCGPAAANGMPLAASLPVRAADAPAPPPITASAAVVVDGETGRVLYDLNAYERRAPASTTKIMTAILALENVSEDNWTMSETDGSTMTGSSVMGLRPGVYIKIRDLLYGLMLPSGNDAAVELAKNVDGYVTDFVDRMNRKVEELGLHDTHFSNPHGLDDPQHYSTAYDLSVIGRYAMANPEFQRIASTQRYTLEPPSSYELVNGNSLLSSYPGSDGVKIGWTEAAGWTIVASAVRDGHRVFVTVLNSEDRNADAAALFDWAYQTYTWDPMALKLNSVLATLRSVGLGEPLVRSMTVCR